MSHSCIAQNGPAITCVTSSTRRPSSAGRYRALSGALVTIRSRSTCPPHRHCSTSTAARRRDHQSSRSQERDDVGHVQGAGRSLRAGRPSRRSACSSCKGAGGKAFVSGTRHRRVHGVHDAREALAYERRIDPVIDRLEGVRVPTIAQVSGVAAGGGCAIALACDMRVCTPRGAVRRADRADAGQLPLGGELRAARRSHRPGADQRHLVHRPADRGGRGVALGW